MAVQADEESLLLINEAIEKLAVQDPQAAELVKLRFFAGFSYEEAAQALSISERSAKRYWTFARAWLYRELSCRRPRVNAGGIRSHSSEFCSQDPSKSEI